MRTAPSRLSAGRTDGLPPALVAQRNCGQLLVAGRGEVILWMGHGRRSRKDAVPLAVEGLEPVPQQPAVPVPPAVAVTVAAERDRVERKDLQRVRRVPARPGPLRICARHGALGDRNNPRSADRRDQTAARAGQSRACASRGGLPLVPGETLMLGMPCGGVAGRGAGRRSFEAAELLRRAVDRMKSSVAVGGTHRWRAGRRVGHRLLAAVAPEPSLARWVHGRGVRFTR